MTARLVSLLAAGAACSSAPRAPLYPAGTDQDDGYGDLAQKSASLLTSADDSPPWTAPRRHAPRDGDPYGGDPYAATYGDDDADPADAADLRPARWSRLHARNLPRDASPTAGLTGAIEGTITWRGARPAPLTTACGAIDHPGVRVTTGGAVAGVLVYIEHVDVGRAIPSYSRPARVGGLIAKHGCVLAPALQIVTPLPAGITVHGDATEIVLRVTQPAPAGKPGLLAVAGLLGPSGQPSPTAVTLQPAGRVVLQAQPGVTRVEADDGSLAAAWVVASDTPYYAITDDAGRFRLDELAAGTYELTVWRPPVATANHGKLIYGAPVIVHRSIKITAKITAARPVHLDLALGP